MGRDRLVHVQVAGLGVSIRGEMDYSYFKRELREYSELFDGVGPIHCARAPGRLDVMGGIADYSGSVVLEKTLEESTWAAAQLGNSSTLRIRSLALARPRSNHEVEIPLE